MDSVESGKYDLKLCCTCTVHTVFGSFFHVSGSGFVCRIVSGQKGPEPKHCFKQCSAAS